MSSPVAAHHRWTVAAVVVALGTAFLGGLWSMTLSPLEHTVGAPPATAPEPVEQISSAPPHRLRIGPSVTGRGWIATSGGGQTWLLGAGTLSVIADGAATEVAHGGWSRDAILAPAGGGAMWIASGRYLWPVSSSGSVGRRLSPKVGAISAVLDADGRTWLAGSDGTRGTLALVDPSTADTQQRYYLGRGASQLAAASGYVFVATRDPTQPPIVRLDPVLGATTPVPGAGTGPIAAADGRLWWGSANAVHCVVAKTLRRCGRVDVRAPAVIAARGESLWVASEAGLDATGDPSSPARLTLFDPRDGRTIAGPLALPSATVTSLAAGDLTAWVGMREGGDVVEIERT
jgi:hypothetical protein